MPLPQGRQALTRPKDKDDEVRLLEYAVLEILLDEFQDEFESELPYLTSQDPRVASEVVWCFLQKNLISKGHKNGVSV